MRRRSSGNERRLFCRFFYRPLVVTNAAHKRRHFCNRIRESLLHDFARVVDALLRPLTRVVMHTDAANCRFKSRRAPNARRALAERRRTLAERSPNADESSRGANSHAPRTQDATTRATASWRRRRRPCDSARAFSGHSIISMATVRRRPRIWRSKASVAPRRGHDDDAPTVFVRLKVGRSVDGAHGRLLFVIGIVSADNRDRRIRNVCKCCKTPSAQIRIFVAPIGRRKSNVFVGNRCAAIVFSLQLYLGAQSKCDTNRLVASVAQKRRKLRHGRRTKQQQKNDRDLASSLRRAIDKNTRAPLVADGTSLPPAFWVKPREAAACTSVSRSEALQSAARAASRASSPCAHVGGIVALGSFSRPQQLKFSIVAVGAGCARLFKPVFGGLAAATALLLPMSARRSSGDVMRARAFCGGGGSPALTRAPLR